MQINADIGITEVLVGRDFSNYNGNRWPYFSVERFSYPLSSVI
jgi:hypothetical protein